MSWAWSGSELVRIAAQAVRDEDGRLHREQAVRGVDALDEVGLHPILGEGFRRAGLGVWPERPYAGRVAERAIRRDRERCDLVLTHEAGSRLLDPVAELVEIDRATGTLFEPVAEAMAGADAGVVEPGEAYWLEVKAVAQFAYVEGVPRANRSYATQLVRGPLGDVRKLAREASIGHAGAMVVLFAEDARTIEHDLAEMTHRLLDQEAPIREPVWEVFAIEDRAGNGACGVALAPVRL